MIYVTIIVCVALVCITYTIDSIFSSKGSKFNEILHQLKELETSIDTASFNSKVLINVTKTLTDKVNSINDKIIENHVDS